MIVSCLHILLVLDHSSGHIKQNAQAIGPSIPHIKPPSICYIAGPLMCVDEISRPGQTSAVHRAQGIKLRLPGRMRVRLPERLVAGERESPEALCGLARGAGRDAHHAVDEEP
jgi:hypothetical protein